MANVEAVGTSEQATALPSSKPLVLVARESVPETTVRSLSNIVYNQWNILPAGASETSSVLGIPPGDSKTLSIAILLEVRSATGKSALVTYIIFYKTTYYFPVRVLKLKSEE